MLIYDLPDFSNIQYMMDYYQGLAGYPLRGNRQCVICIKYRIIFCIIISLGQVLLSHIANTLHTHARTHPHTCTHSRFRLSLFNGSVAPNHDGVNASLRRFGWQSMDGRCFIQINSRAGVSVFAIILGVFRV